MPVTEADPSHRHRRLHQAEVLPDETREMMQAERYHAFMRFHRNIEVISSVLRPGRSHGTVAGGYGGDDDELPVSTPVSAIAAQPITACADEAALARMRTAIEAEASELRVKHAQAMQCTFGFDSACGDGTG